VKKFIFLGKSYYFTFALCHHKSVPVSSVMVGASRCTSIQPRSHRFDSHTEAHITMCSRHLVRRCQWYIPVPCKYAQYCTMILCTKFFQR